MVPEDVFVLGVSYEYPVGPPNKLTYPQTWNIKC